MLDILNEIKVYSEEIDFLNDLQARMCKEQLVVSFCNAHSVNLMYKNHKFKNNLLSSNFLLRDGLGVKIAMRVFGLMPGKNLNGTDLIPYILENNINAKIAVLGTRDPWLSTATELLGEKHKVVLALDGFQSDDEYLRSVVKFQPEIIILGMGMPKQERISFLISEEINYPCIIINGGAIIDFISGRFERAPSYIRKCGMEWAYRLAREPKRLFKRYVIGNLLFLIRVFIAKVQSRS